MVTVVGICAYNEASNIERAIRSVYEQRDVAIDKVIVVSSGSTDDTNEIVQRLEQEFDTLKLIPQEKREGKNSAINVLLDNANADIVVLFNADNIMSNDQVLHDLLAPFSDEKMGVIGGRPMPLNKTDTKIGFACVMLWTMHHHISLIHPKIGELIAFKDIGTRLPTDVQSDEDIIKMELAKKGYKSAYAPTAVALNRGPETEEEFLRQRIRVNLGEIYMKKKCNFEIPSWNKKLLIKSLLATMKDMGFHPLRMMSSILLESKARRIAKKRFSIDGDPDAVWEHVGTTKKI